MTTKSPFGTGPNQLVAHHMLGSLAYRDSPDSEFAPIASASTVNLNVRGTIGHLTGSVTVNAFTLARGECKTIIVDGTPVITHSASIIVQGGASYTCVAGDVIRVYGDAGGVVRVLIDTQVSGYMKVSDRKPSGTSGGASVAATITQTRTFNTTEYNSIPGATLAADTVGVLAGTYDFRGRAPGSQSVSHKAFLYNVTDASYAGIGSNASCSGTSGESMDSVFSGRITVASAKNFMVRHYTSATSSNGLGAATSTGQLEVYTELEFWKVG